ncbi:MAG: pentapeptide repeat-containing protein [Scytolyngbya sp. HA4215-MV1]|nr:pentapeptide repeat-containing protein [Scytolyngbya sp. HA4215-MV1]
MSVDAVATKNLYRQAMIDIQELLDRYTDGERDFSSIGMLKQLSVPAGTDLRGINLQRCQFQNVDFSGVNLAGANLSGIFCQFTRFRNADLNRVNFSQATLGYATDLSGANLSFANLTQLSIEEATLEGANLVGVDLGEAIIKQANLRTVNLVQANLWGLWITNTDLEGANLAEVDLSEIKTWGLNETSGVNLDGAILPDDFLKQNEQGKTIPQNLLNQISEEDLEIIQRNYLRFGDHIGAIKFCRVKTGLDLAQAKSMIDLIAGLTES